MEGYRGIFIGTLTDAPVSLHFTAGRAADLSSKCNKAA
jgi:hypothetical protein